MTDLIDSLLDLHRLQLGRPLELSREPVDLNAIVQTVIEELPVDARQPIQVDAPVEPLTGSWDGTRLARVTANLLSNALKYSPPHAAIDVSLKQESENGVPWVALAVRDRGIGIPATDLSRIGERFYRASNVPRQIGGTGLGLASARQIVQQHGGEMTVTSQEGQGTTVTIRLPMSGESLTPGPSPAGSGETEGDTDSV